MPEKPKKPGGRRRMSRKKQAILLIHGIGEQAPMGTLRSFVETVWVKNKLLNARSESDPPAAGNPVWSKPDFQSGGYEMRRLTTRSIDCDSLTWADLGPRTDFFEFYWADLMEGTTFRHVWDWLSTLLFRRFRNVPTDVRFAWCVLWIVFLSIALAFLLLAMPKFAWMEKLGPLVQFRDWVYQLKFLGLVTGGTLLAGIAAIVRWCIRSGPIISHIGDVARYVRVRPWNIARRHAVRSRGMQLLRSLHDSGKYDRIIVVGHSLGSIVGYDLVSYLWAEHYKQFEISSASATAKHVREIEKFYQHADAKNPFQPDLDAKAFRKAQNRLFQSLRDDPDRPWLISDFVTVGSPLTHADFLIAHNEDLLRKKQEAREIPTCPPTPERQGERWAITYTFRQTRRSVTYVNHGTVFAPVRWTNLYDKHAVLVLGDIISGPVAGHFGDGVVDVDVPMDRRWFTHTSYWSWREAYDRKGAPDHIKVLIDALNLRDSGDPAMDWVTE